mgnify:CR=1 FL=1
MDEIQNYLKQKFNVLEKQDSIKQLDRRTMDLNILRLTKNVVEGLYKFQNKKEFKIYKIVFTGGPCAGKTTALNTVGSKLS